MYRSFFKLTQICTYNLSSVLNKAITGPEASREGSICNANFYMWDLWRCAAEVLWCVDGWHETLQMLWKICILFCGLGCMLFLHVYFSLYRRQHERLDDLRNSLTATVPTTVPPTTVSPTTATIATTSDSTATVATTTTASTNPMTSGNILTVPTEPLGVCENISVITMCSHIGYKEVYLPNFREERNVSIINNELSDYGLLIASRCADVRTIEVLLCSVYAPFCRPPTDVSKIIKRIHPCRAVCEVVKKGCLSQYTNSHHSWPSILNCDSAIFKSDPTAFCITSDDATTALPSPWCQQGPWINGNIQLI